jgi:hypothetical protein
VSWRERLLVLSGCSVSVVTVTFLLAMRLWGLWLMLVVSAAVAAVARRAL